MDAEREKGSDELNYLDWLRKEIENDMLEAENQALDAIANLNLACVVDNRASAAFMAGQSEQLTPGRLCELLESAADTTFEAWQTAKRALTLQEALEAYSKID